MVDEQEPIAEMPEASGAETPPAPTGEANQAEPENLEAAPEGEAEGEPEPAPEDDLEDFEWNGQSFKMPKGFKKDFEEGSLRQADYTRKTQTVAEQRRELADREKRIGEQAKAIGEELDLRADYRAISKQVEQYRNVDWATLWATDRDTAQQHQFAYQELQRQQNDLAQQINQRASQRTAQAEQAQQEGFAKRMQETTDYARATIKDWSPETDKQVVEFATAQGIEMNDLRGAMNPTIYGILYKAMKFDQILQKPVAKPKVATPQPTQMVGAKANPPVRKSLADMSMDEYVAARQKQMAKRG